MYWYLNVLKKYAVFRGRARRTEYWMFVLVNLIISGLLSFGLGIVGLEMVAEVYSLAVLLPGICVGVRRLHDIGKSGLWLLIAFVPLVGWIFLLILMCKDSEPGMNAYGPNPKEDKYAI